MDERLCFVQFLHPGGEHGPGPGGVTPWNPQSRPHRRKFLVSQGRHVEAPGSGEPKDGRICFWGEWEPPSRVTALGTGGGNGLPRFLHEPFLESRPDYAGAQNTDPFVFWECFHYTGCQQNTKRGPTQLRHLRPGSVILFGSHSRGAFLLDTVFVVARFVDHTQADYRRALRGALSDGYRTATIAPWYGESASCRPISISSPRSYRLYFGATHEEPFRGMFSFFPCQPHVGGTSGFARPGIQIGGVVTDSLRQGKRLNRQTSVDDVCRLWDGVVRQVTAQGLRLGVSAVMPPWISAKGQPGED